MTDRLSITMGKLRKLPVWVFLLLVSLLPVIPFLHEGLPITHDGPDHVARIANFFASISEGNPIPRWAASLNWGYGHPILMFLYPMSSYVGSFFHVLGFPFVDAVKMVFAVSFVASVFSMYLWVSKGWGNRAGILAAILYGFAPYRFVDMTVRGAIGEHVAFVFPPLVCYFLLVVASADVSMRKSGWRSFIASGYIGLTLSLSGLVLSHNAVSLMFLPVFGLYGLYLLFFESRNRIAFVVSCSVSVLLAFGVSAFFWMPALLEGKYTLRDIVTRGETVTRFVPWSWFFLSGWRFGQGNEFTKNIGFVQWLGILSLPALWGGKKSFRDRWFLAGTLAVLLVSLVLMTAVSRPVWDAVSIMQKFQFPWRFLSVSVFAAAVIAGIAATQTLGKIADTRVRDLTFAFILFVSVASTIVMWSPSGYTHKPENYYTGIYDSTTDTGESSPIWSVRFMEHRATESATIISGNALIVPKTRTTTSHIYTVRAEDSSRILENTLYFPGWSVTVDGRQADLQFQDPDYRGLITYMVPSGEHTVVVTFGSTKIRRLAEFISGASLFVVGVYTALFLFSRRRYGSHS